MNTVTDNRKITNAFSRYADFYRIGIGLVLVLIGVWIGAMLFSDGYFSNLYTETLSVVVTVLVLDRLNERRMRQQTTEELKKRLVREVGSQSNEIAKAAVEYLRAEGWLTIRDNIALLKNAHLHNAKLQGSDLYEANLQDANLRYANLQDANLRHVNLQGTNLGRSNLQQAYFESANLQYAILRFANLQHATLWNSSLCHIEQIDTAIFDEKTVLPDAQPMVNESGNWRKDDNGNYVYDKYWTPQTDMRRYTDPQHPDFWEPDYLKPDYEGDKPWWVEKRSENQR